MLLRCDNDISDEGEKAATDLSEAIAAGIESDDVTINPTPESVLPL